MGLQEITQTGSRQVETQRAIAAKVAESNIKGARIIAGEINQQTRALSNTISRINHDISGAIEESAALISSVINNLADRLCVELAEIQWQLVQQQETQERILEVLYNSRNNQARQLVEQGVRHYINDELEEAEERFNKALDYSTIDYQVLMNLAYIEERKGNIPAAIKFFGKAHKLPNPETLDFSAKARALWAIATLYLKEKEFSQAYSYALKAFNNENQEAPGINYKMGIYSALAGETTMALDYIKKPLNVNRNISQRLRLIMN